MFSIFLKKIMIFSNLHVDQKIKVNKKSIPVFNNKHCLQQKTLLTYLLLTYLPTMVSISMLQ